MPIFNFWTLYLQPRSDPDTYIVVNKNDSSCQLFTYTFTYTYAFFIIHVPIGTITLEQHPIEEWHNLILIFWTGNTQHHLKETLTRNRLNEVWYKCLKLWLNEAKCIHNLNENITITITLVIGDYTTYYDN